MKTQINSTLVNMLLIAILIITCSSTKPQDVEYKVDYITFTSTYHQDIVEFIQTNKKKGYYYTDSFTTSTVVPQITVILEKRNRVY